MVNENKIFSFRIKHQAKDVDSTADAVSLFQLRSFFFQPKNTDIFLISPREHMLWFSLEAPWQGAHNKYTQHMFSWTNKKKICGDTPSYLGLYYITI